MCLSVTEQAHRYCFDGEVLIIGAGAAGLAAARVLEVLIFFF